MQFTGAPVLAGVVAKRHWNQLLAFFCHGHLLAAPAQAASLMPFKPGALDRTALYSSCPSPSSVQARLGLNPDPSVPLFGFIGRLEEQKGADVLLAALPKLLGPTHGAKPFNPQLQCDPNAAAQAAQPPTKEAGGSVPCDSSATAAAPVPSPGQTAATAAVAAPATLGPAPRLQLAMLGTGQPWIEQALRCLDSAYPGSAAGVPQHNEALAHLLMAGCDYLIVPSRYEPCGLVALCAIQYGTVPIVSPIGGLLDIMGGQLPSKRDAELAEEGQGVRALMASAAERTGKPQGASTDQQQEQEEQAQGQQQGPQGQTPEAEFDVTNVRAAPLGYVLTCPPPPTDVDSEAAVLYRRAVASLMDAVAAAARDYAGGQGLVYREMRGRCLQTDVSWGTAVRQWEQALWQLLGVNGHSD